MPKSISKEGKKTVLYDNYGTRHVKVSKDETWKEFEFVTLEDFKSGYDIVEVKPEPTK